MIEIPVIVSILTRYQRQEPLSESEKRILENWLRASEANQDLFNDLSNEEGWNREIADLQAKDDSATWSRIQERIEAMQEKPAPVHYIFPFKRWAAIAAIFIVAVAGTYFLIGHHNSIFPERNETQAERFRNDIPEAKPQPMLTLANGTQIRLDTASPGRLAVQQNDNNENNIWKTDSNSLVIKETANGREERLNTLSTPIGTQYRLTLSDGSRVWLNAGSGLQFPSTFTGAYRKVILTGEAYFEVAKNAAKPFYVETGNSSTRVLGTHFNVRSYATEPTTKTTLLEGLVIFRAGRDSAVLRPGRQASLRQNGIISVDSVNVQQAVAWRDNLFWFQAETFEGIMTELGRWYPIRVHYQGKISEKFSGILPRGRSLIEVLKTLELAGYVNFRVSGNEVDVIPRKTGTESS